MSLYQEHVRRWFDLPRRVTRRFHRVGARAVPTGDTLDRLLPAAGELLLIVGPSASGKSSLLARLRARLRSAPVDVTGIPLALPDGRGATTVDRVVAAIDPTGATADETPDACEARLVRALELLSRVGLAEPVDYLRHPARLSEGQRFRLRLAVALAEAQRRAACTPAVVHDTPATVVLTCDEFASSLDELTACVVSRCLRREVDATHPGSGAGLSAIVVTARPTGAIVEALRPNRVVRCDFGAWRVATRSPAPATSTNR